VAGLDDLTKLMALKEAKQQMDVRGHAISRLEDLKTAREKATLGKPVGTAPSGEPMAGPPVPLTPEQVTEQYAVELEKLGRTEDSQKVRTNQLVIERAQQDLAIAKSRYATQGALQGSQLIKAGHKTQGLEVLRRFDPNIIDAEVVDGGFLLKTKDNPDGQVIPEEYIIQGATNAETQYEQLMRERARKDAEAKTPLPQSASTADVKLFASDLKGGAYDELAKGVSKLDDKGRRLFARDVLDRAKALQAAAKKKGEVLDAGAAREMAAIELRDKIKINEYLGGMWTSAEYTPLVDNKDKPKAWSEQDKKNIATIAKNNNITEAEAEKAYQNYLEKRKTP